MGGDSVLDAAERGHLDSGWRGGGGQFIQERVVVLLELEQNTIDELHSDDFVDGRLGNKTVEVRVHLIHSVANVRGDRSRRAVKHIRDYRPATKLFYRHKDFSGERRGIGGEHGGVVQTEGGSSFDQLSLLDQGLDGGNVAMSVTCNVEGSEPGTQG